MTTIKNSNKEKSIINLTATTSKNVKLNEKKKSNLKKKIDVSTMTDEQILNLNLDDLNLTDFNKLVQSKKETLKTSNRINMYKIEVDKKLRKKLRNQRDKFKSNIIYYFNNKNKKDLKEEIKSFNKFYKETYSLNDYSLLSVASNNSDKQTKVELLIMLKIIKDNK